MYQFTTRFSVVIFCLLFLINTASGITGGRLKASTKSSVDIAEKYYKKGLTASQKAENEERKAEKASSEGKKEKSLAKAEKQYKRAISNYKKALKVMPNLTIARAKMGHALLKTGKYSAAIEEFDEVLGLDSDNKQVESERAQAKAALENQSS